MLNLIQKRGYAGLGMGPLWGRISTNGEGLLAKLRAKRLQKEEEELAANSKNKSAQLTLPGKGAVLPEGRHKPAASVSRSPTMTTSPFDLLEKPSLIGGRKPIGNELWMQTPFFRGSTQKLNLLGRQISGLQLDAAILQMRFSPKKAAKEALEVLCKIRLKIQGEGARPAEFYIKQIDVGRGTYLKRMDFKGRGRFGIMWKGHRFMRVCVHKPDPRRLVAKLLRIKHFPREDKPILRKLDY